MIVCHCRALNDRAIRSVIEQAVVDDQGVLDLDRLAAECGAGARCGGCQPMLVELLQQARRASVAA